jgi:hypothetical protein
VLSFVWWFFLKAFSGWSVRSWLSSIGLSQYGETFESNGLTDPAVVATITESDLQAIGITMLGHKKKILMEAPKISQGLLSFFCLNQTGVRKSLLTTL